ncbi:MAG: hypothetical protein GXP63_07535, partial [DPANN group archaeon]|nr:hypothetical protein [DPANN group archaeon]
LKEGFNDVLLVAVDAAGNMANHSVSFWIDSRLPRITKTLPDGRRDYATGTFALEYNEENVDEVALYYWFNDDPQPLTPQATRTDCPSGTRAHCTINVSLADHDAEDVSYYFTLLDKGGNEVTSHPVYDVEIDARKPTLHVYSPLDGVNQSRLVLFNLTVDDVGEREATLTYSDNGRRDTRLCSRCHAYARSRGFSRGTHELLIKAVDKAGNVDQKLVSFVVE